MTGATVLHHISAADVALSQSINETCRDYVFDAEAESKSL